MILSSRLILPATTIQIITKSGLLRKRPVTIPGYVHGVGKPLNLLPKPCSLPLPKHCGGERGEDVHSARGLDDHVIPRCRVEAEDGTRHSLRCDLPWAVDL